MTRIPEIYLALYHPPNVNDHSGLQSSGSDMQDFDSAGCGPAAWSGPYEDEVSHTASTESEDPSVASGTASLEDFLDDPADMDSTAIDRLNWPLPPTSKFSILKLETRSPLVVKEEMNWPLPSGSPATERSLKSYARTKRFHPYSAASIQLLVSTPNWPLPSPAPRISFDERHRVTERVSPPSSPVWPLPPSAKSFGHMRRPRKSTLESTASSTSPTSCDCDSSWESSRRSDNTSETAFTAQTSFDEAEVRDEEDERDSRVHVVSPDDWFARFYPDDDYSDTATDDCPDRATLAAVQHIPIFDADGNSRTFGSLYEPATATHQRQLIIFIRHFYCGGCQAYLKALTEAVTMREYFSIPIPTNIVVIGCGQPNLINYYQNFTKCPFPIFAEPSRKLFKKLGMAVSANLGYKTPGYMKGVGTVPWLANQVKNIHNGLWNDPEHGISPKDVFRGGNIMQIGGEFLFEDGQVLWCHRMRHARNHAEVTVLRKLLELDDPDNADGSGT